MIVTRFAPSPNGPLHLGHAYSAVVAHDLAVARAGRFLLRIEDIDGARSRGELAAEFRADLGWLGLAWTEVAPQSQRAASYASAARQLRDAGLLYPCRCTRPQIAAAAQVTGPDGPVYAGTCRSAAMESGEALAWRLDTAEAMRRVGRLTWLDEIAGEQVAQPERAGDVVLVRKDRGTPASYHLAATLDDAADGVTLVTRGLDLFAASDIHRLLQALLGLPVPTWHHHALLMVGEGRKLAKRRGAGAGTFGLGGMRQSGADGTALADALRNSRLPTGISLSAAPYREA